MLLTVGFAKQNFHLSYSVAESFLIDVVSTISNSSNGTSNVREIHSDILTGMLKKIKIHFCPIQCHAEENSPFLQSS